MKTLRRRIQFALPVLGLALAHLCLPLSAQNPGDPRQPAPLAGTFRIAGVAVNAATGAPLANTRITIVDTRNSRNAQWMITGEGGRFEFTRLVAGKYSLQGARRGFVGTAYEQHGQFSTAIVAGEAWDTANLTLRLPPTAAITGRVLNESGEPVRNANVKLFRETHGSGASEVVAVEYGTTDDRGFFEFAPLNPGVFFVSATARPWYYVRARPSRTGTSYSAVDPSLDMTYPTTYYSGTTESDTATPIPVKSGDHAEIDFHLEPVASLHLTFHAPKDGQNGVFPTLEKREFDVSEQIAADVSDQFDSSSSDSSVMDISGVPPGRYTVRWHSPQSAEGGQATEINITKDGQDLDAPGEPLASLKLSVKVRGEEKLPDQLSVYLLSLERRPVGEHVVDGNGEAWLQSLPAGTYNIFAGTPDTQYYVIQTSTQGAETRGHSVTLTPGSSLSVSVLLAGTNNMARVEGFAQRSGKPAHGVMVVLVPDNPEADIDFFRRDQSDSDGSFVLLGIIPGSYTIIAVEDGWTLEWSKPEVLAHYLPRGQKLTIGPQQRGTVTLPQPIEAQPR